MTLEPMSRWSDELALDPNSVAFVQLADELRRQRQLDEARAVALRGLERHPYLPDAHDVLARVYADAGELERARDEWEMALRLDPRHPAALKGLGFLAYRRRDLANAERYLREALALDTADAGLATAHRRVLDALRADASPSPRQRNVAPNESSAPDAPASVRARELFAALLGDGDRTALLLDRDGLVLAGAYVDAEGRDTADEIGAELSGVSDEASRALTHLGLGTWTTLLVEAQHATVGLAPAGDGAIVLVAAARDTNVGFVRRLVTQARDRAVAWLGATP